MIVVKQPLFEYTVGKGVSVVEDMIISVNTLPEPLHRLIKSEKAKVRGSGGEIRIVPILDSLETDSYLAIKHAAVEAEDKMRRLYELCGSGADLQMTVDSFLAMTHDEKEFDGE